MAPTAIDQPVGAFSSGSLPADGDPHIAGEIGAQLLRRFTVIFDFPRHEMILEPNNDFRTEDHEDMSGLTMAATGPGLAKRFEVEQVRPGTPGAADGGVEKGDVIAGVDEEPAADLSLADLRGLFLPAWGPQIQAGSLVERNGKTITLTFQTRPADLERALVEAAKLGSHGTQSRVHFRKEHCSPRRICPSRCACRRVRPSESRCLGR